MEINKDNWKQIDLNVDSLWLIPERERQGASTRISITAISFPNYSNAYECRKYRAGVVRRQRDYPVRI